MSGSAWFISDLCDFVFSIKINTIYIYVLVLVVIFVVIWSEEWIAVESKLR